MCKLANNHMHSYCNASLFHVNVGYIREGIGLVAVQRK